MSLSGLFMRRKRAVALYVGDPRISRQVVLLHVFQEFGEAAMVVRAVLLINIVGDDRQGGQAIEPRAPLMARSHVVAQLPVDLHPGNQISLCWKGEG